MMPEHFMLTLACDRKQSLQQCGHLLWEYSFFVRQELRNPVIYLTSLLIGILATWMMNTPSIIPFLIPFDVSFSVSERLLISKRDIRTQRISRKSKRHEEYGWGAFSETLIERSSNMEGGFFLPPYSN